MAQEPEIDLSDLPDQVDLTDLPDQDRSGGILSGVSSFLGKYLNEPWEKINTPMVKFGAEKERAAFAQEHPWISKPLEMGVGAVEGLTSPLSVGLMATPIAAEGAVLGGFSNLARGLAGAEKVAGTGMVIHGGKNVAEGLHEGDYGKAIGGGLEALGGMGARSAAKGRTIPPIDYESSTFVKPSFKFDQELGVFRPSNPQAIGAMARQRAVNKAAEMTNEVQKKSLWQEGLDANRAVLTAYDLSAPGRQGKPFLLNKEYWTSFDDMVKSWGSERAYQAVNESIFSHPNFIKPKVKTAAGFVELPSLADRAGLNIGAKSELFRSQIAEKIPGVRQSERAYNAFLEKMRSDVFNSLVENAEKAGYNIKQNDVMLKEVGKFINDATGVGKVPGGKIAGIGLNDVFFAPQLMASRVNMYKTLLNPFSYAYQNPALRKQALKSLIATVGFGNTIGQVAKLAGASVSGDPTSSDFGKVKVGDSRYDPFSGFQQYAVGASRFLSGELTSSNTGKEFDLTSGKFGMPTRQSVVQNFFANKLAPVPSLVWSWMAGKEFDGTPFEAKKALLSRTVPIVMQDLYELAQEDPDLLPEGSVFRQHPTATKAGLGGLSLLGEGLQTYGR